MQLSKKNGIIIIIFLILLSILGTKNFFNKDNDEHILPPKTKVVAENFKVITYSPRFYGYGIVNSSKKIKLLSQADGYLEKKLISKNQKVKKGDVIAELDLRDVQNIMQQAESTLKNSEIQYNSVYNLFKQKLSSNSDLNAAEAQLQAARAKLVNAKRLYHERKIVSPIDGLLNEFKPNIGTFIKKYSVIGEITGSNKYKIKLFVSEKHIPTFHKGQNAKVKLNDDLIIDAKLNYVARVANNDNKLFKLELNFNTEKQIFEGTTAEVIVELNPIENIIKVPSSALIIKENSLFVKYLNEESKVKELKVKIIDEDKDGLYVLIQDHIDAASLSIITLGALEVDNVEIVEHQSEL